MREFGETRPSLPPLDDKEELRHPAASGPATATATIVDQIEAFKSEYPVLAYVAEHGSNWGAMSHNEQVVLTHYLALA